MTGGFGHSQEVIGSASGHVGLAAAWGWVELKAEEKNTKSECVYSSILYNALFNNLMFLYLQGVFQSVVQFHDGSLVSTAVAVVWSTKDGHHILIMAPVVALNV